MGVREEQWEVLHKLGGATRGLLQGVEEALKYFGADPFPSGAISDDDLRCVLAGPAESLREALAGFVAPIRSPGAALARGVAQETLAALVSAEEHVSDLPEEMGAYAIGLLDKAARLALQTTHDMTGRNRARVNSSQRKVVEERAREVRRLLAILALRRALANAGAVVAELYEAMREESQANLDTDGQPMMADLEVCLSEAVRDVMKQVEARGIEIRADVRLSGERVRCSPPRLVSALEHILDNAVKYMGKAENSLSHASTWITLRARATGNTATVDVESWGAPVTHEEYDNDLLFKAGYRGRYARRRGIEGTGMGLFEVRRIVRQAGGDVTIDTTPVSRDHTGATETTTTVRLALPTVSATATESPLLVERD
jgi:signal transduction histidine kinase